MATRTRRRGRPSLKRGAAKASILGVRFTADDRRAIDDFADSEGKTPSEWVRDIVLAEIDRIIDS